MRFYGRLFPGVPMHQMFLINFAFGTATGAILGGLIAVVYFLS
jgi:hypothetical protein